MKSQDDLEKPMKVYQGEALHAEITNVRKLIEEQTTMLKTTITLPYFEERLKNMKENFEAELVTVRQEYRPFLGNAKWVAKTAIGAFVSVILMVIGIYLKS